jgi:hypothetical protein
VAVRHASRQVGIVLGLPRPLTSTCVQVAYKAAGVMEGSILEDAVRFTFLVAIKISYPVFSKSRSCSDAPLWSRKTLTRLDRSAETDGATTAGGVSDAEPFAVGELESVEVTLPAFLLVRESGFFRAALTAGLEETHSRVIKYEAADAEGGSEPVCRVCASCARWPAADKLAVAVAEKDDLMLFFTLLHAGKGYLQHNGESLQRDQLLRLLVLGAKLQADECIGQCAAELGVKAAHLETALGVMEEVPAEMDAYPDVRAVREHAWDALVEHVEVSDFVSD